MADYLLVIWAVIAFLVAASGLMLAPSERGAEICAVALFVAGTSVVMLSFFAAI